MCLVQESYLTQEMKEDREGQLFYINTEQPRFFVTTCCHQGGFFVSWLLFLIFTELNIPLGQVLISEM